MPPDLSSQQAFDRLVLILNEKGLSWIVSQVETQARLGKHLTRRVKELRPYTTRARGESLQVPGRFPDSEDLRPGREVPFRATEAYTDNERLGLLVSAMRHAVINASDMVGIVSRHFVGVTFVSEEGERQLAVGELESEARSREVDRLGRLLNDLDSQLR